MYFPPWPPPLNFSPPIGAHGGHLGLCHEQNQQTIYKGIYIQKKIQSVLILGLEKIKVYPLGGPPPGPPGSHKLNMKKVGSLPPEDDPNQLWLKSALRF